MKLLCLTFLHITNPLNLIAFDTFVYLKTHQSWQYWTTNATIACMTVYYTEQQYNWEGSLCRQTRDGFEPLSQFIPKASNKMLLLWPIMQTNSEKWMYLTTFSTKFQPCPWLILLYKILWLWIGPYAVHYLAASKSKFRFALILSGQICPPQKAISTASIAQFPNKACKVAQSAKLFVSTITSKP